MDSIHAVAVVLAAANTNSTNGPDPTVLLQYGAVGFLAALGVYTSWNLYRRLLAAYRREQQRADRLEEELRALNQTVQELMTQALRDATSAVADALDTVAERRRNNRRQL